MATTAYDTTTDRAYKVGPLNELDNWKVHEDDCDIRGWNLFTADGQKIGEVETLIADTEEKEVRYVEVELDDSINKYRDLTYRNQINPSYRSHFGKDDDDHILIPIGLISIDKNNKKVIASSNLTTTTFASGPRYRGSRTTAIVPAQELTVARYYSDLDNTYRNTYTDEEYDYETFESSPYNIRRKFYSTDFFNSNRYWQRYNNPRMAGAQTGGIA